MQVHLGDALFTKGAYIINVAVVVKQVFYDYAHLLLDFAWRGTFVYGADPHQVQLHRREHFLRQALPAQYSYGDNHQQTQVYQKVVFANKFGQ